MKLPRDVPVIAGRPFIELAPEISAAILRTVKAGWALALKSPDVNAGAAEVPMTERLRDGMRSALNGGELPWGRTMVVLSGTESRSRSDVLLPDGRIDIPILWIGICIQSGEHDPHAIIECKRIAGQIKFMIKMKYLSKRNVLSWNDLSEILGTYGTIPYGQDLERHFDDLAEKWMSETAHYSMMSSIVLHRSYQEIIGLGRDVLPLVLKKLSVQPNHWFWALRAISGEDPVPACDVGKFDAMRDAWLDWGRKQGLM